MAQWLDWIAAEEIAEDDVEFRRLWSVHEESVSPHRHREEDWEHFWTDLGGEG